MAITFNHNDQVYVKDGKMGIGASDPLRNLHVVGNFAVNAGTGEYYGVYIPGLGEGADPQIQIGDWHNASATIKWDSSARALNIDTQYSSGAGTFNITGNDGASTFLTVNTSGNVGIGTTNPVSHSQNRRTLVVADTVDGANVEIWGNSAGGKSILQSVGGNTYVGNLANGTGAGTTFITSGAGNTYTTILANGNVGIDAVPESGMVTYIKQLRIGEQGAVQSHAQGVGVDSATWLTNNYKFGSSGAEFINGTVAAPGYATVYQQQTGEHSFSTSNATGVAGGTPTMTVQMVIKQSGNVGIGNTSPQNTLHLGDNANASAGTLRIDSFVANQFWKLQPGTNTFSIKDYDGTSLITFDGANNYALFPGGNVGIGTTSPTAKLDVNGEIFASSNVQISAAGLAGKYYIRRPSDGSASAYFGYTSADNTDFGIYNGSGGGNIKFNSNNGIFQFNNLASGELVRITSAGNVGIGTTLPFEKLDVSAKIYAQDRVVSADVTNPNKNLLAQATIKVSNLNDIYSNATKTIISAYEARYVNDNTGTTTIRGNAETGALVNGEVYTLSIYYKDLIGSLSLDLGDTALVGLHTNATGTTANPTSGRIYGRAIRTNNAYSFIDINLSQNGSVTILNPKLEQGSVVTEFIATTEEEGVPQTITTNDIIATGNVGIGTNNVTRKLQVDAGSGYALSLNSTQQYLMEFARGGVSEWWFAVNNGDFKFHENGVGDQVIIKAGGNVGIGTTAPGNKLHIKDGASGFASAFDARNKVIVESNGEAYYSSYVPDNSFSGIRFFNSSALKGFIDYYHGTNGDALVYAATGYHKFLTGGTEKVRIDSAGNVGIGTTAPGAKLEVDSSTTPQILVKNSGGGNAQILFEDNSGLTQNASITFDQAGQNSLSITTGYVSTNDTNKILLQPGGNTAMTLLGGNDSTSGDGAIQFNGYVGTRQTGTPTYLLGTDASGNIVKTNTVPGSAAGPYLPLAGGTMTGGLNIEVSASNTQLKLKRTTSATGEFNIYTNTDSLFFHNVGQSTYPMMINSSGNVGIGTTSPTEAKLVVESTSEVIAAFGRDGTDGDVVQVYNGLAGTTKVIALGASGNDGTIYSQYGNLLLQQSAGNVGIGTTGPASKFHVSSSATNSIEIDGSGNQKMFSYSDSGGVGWCTGKGAGNWTNLVYLNTNDDAISIYTNDSLNTTFTAQGNVGIGTTSPTHKLHVDGDMRLTGALRDSNNAKGSAGQVLSSTGSATDWIPLPAAATVYTPKVYNLNNSTNINSQGQKLVPDFDTLEIEGDTTIQQVSGSDTDFQVTGEDIGIYEVTYAVFYKNTGNQRTPLGTYLTLNGTAVNGSLMVNYVRSDVAGGGNWSSCTNTFYVNVTDPSHPMALCVRRADSSTAPSGFSMVEPAGMAVKSTISFRRIS